MIKDDKGVTDGLPAQAGPSGSALLVRDMSLSPVSYTKTDNLITALYMVTEVMAPEEPLRIKLRTLGVDIVSDLHSNFRMEINFLQKVRDRIDEIMSFLGIAETLNLISEMNSNILKKEFSELKHSVKVLNPDGALSLFFKKEKDIPANSFKPTKKQHAGHQQPTRIGVQKGNTLMKALSDSMPEVNKTNNSKDNFVVLKKERRNQIINIIGDNPQGLTITDIKSKAQGTLASHSEKTLQRELISMVQDHVLKKLGEKRWSRYFLPN